jgi:2,3-bisphosphoglycerate-independent phosphoglycerate mutase
VPFVFVSDTYKGEVKDGILADVAPSILKVMGIEAPADMTGSSLIEN